MTIPTMQQSVDAAVAAIEARLGQTVPLYDKSFLRVLSVVLGMNNAELYRFGVQRAKQVLALTARGDDLTHLGLEYGIVRKPAQKAILDVIVEYSPSATVNIYRSDTLRSDDNGFYYFPIQDYTFAAGTPICNISVRAEFAGSSGDLTAPATLYWTSQPDGVTIAGAYVQSTLTAGADEETDDELRLRVLTEIQTVGGGSNDADYRTWGQRTPNVLRIDPYTGQPPWAPTPVFVPGERTVYVESTDSYGLDGAADAALLDLVRDYIEYDQDTGLRQVCLGSTSDTLEVLSITRIPAYFEVNSLSVESTRLYDCTQDIISTLEDLARGMHPFILGLDSEAFRNDVLSSSYAARHVQRVVQAYGGSVGIVNCGTTSGDWDTPIQLDPGIRLSAEVTVNVSS